MLLDIKLSKAQLYKTFQWDGFLGDLTISLGKKSQIDLVVSLAKDVLLK